MFVSGPKLDEHVIFQTFGLYQPWEDYDTYTTLADNADMLAEWGITDVWMPPPYRVAGDSKYREGYAIADRYDLGAYGKGPTKYGTAEQLKAAIDAVHAEGMSVQVDVVPNQVIGLPTREVLPVTSVDNSGNPNNPNIQGLLYAAYVKGTAPGQTEHGHIKAWDNYHFNGTSPQNQGLYRVIVGADGQPLRYFGPNDPRNNLPAWLANSDAAKYGKINTVDDYVLIDSYYAVEGAETEFDAVYVPILFHYIDPRPGAMTTPYLEYARANGYPGATDDEVRAKLLADAGPKLGAFTDAYLRTQPGYSKASESGITALRFDAPDNNRANINVNNLQYEFLIGNDLDTTREDVQLEQLNWQEFLLDAGFDGFRIDAASHINTDMLRQEVDQRLSYFKGEDPYDHLTYIESYTQAQVPFERSNRQGQLVLDSAQYDANLAAFGRKKQAVKTVFTNSLVNRLEPTADPIPNWSFVNNHDQEHNVLVEIPLTAAEAGEDEPNTLPYELKQFAKYNQDRNRVQKQWAPFNVPVQYAIMLTNKDTVPTVFYGDMYDTTAGYMKEKTPYYDDIVDLLEMRKEYVSGEQRVTLQPSKSSSELGGDLVSSARLGTSRDTGVAVVAGNFPGLDDTIRIDMGKHHANQVFRDATGNDPDVETTDANGILTVSVKGFADVDINGYLAAYVPGESASTDYRTILDGTAASFADWAYTGRGGFNRNADGTITSRVGANGGFGTLWYTKEQFRDFELRVQFRDDAPGTQRANSGVQVRFPALDRVVPGCTPVRNGLPDLAWTAVQCGHEVQINDSPEAAGNDPRKTGSIYGFDDLNLAQARPTSKGVWNELIIRVVDQHYTVIRNGVVINEFHNAPGLPFPGRPDDPGSSARGLMGYVGLQAHGAPQDVMTFGRIEVRDLTGTSRSEASLVSLDALFDGLVAQGRINPRVAATVRDRLDRAAELVRAGSETRAIGLLQQAIARANNQIKGDADDLRVRAAVVSQLQALIVELREQEAAESAT